MKDIKTIGIIGLGALGTMYATLLTQSLGKERVLVLADRERTERYRRDGMWYNGERCDLNYTDAASVKEPVDVLLFAVKYTGLPDAIETCRHLVGPETHADLHPQRHQQRRAAGGRFRPGRRGMVHGGQDGRLEGGQPRHHDPHRAPCR